MDAVTFKALTSPAQRNVLPPRRPYSPEGFGFAAPECSSRNALCGILTNARSLQPAFCGTFLDRCMYASAF